MARLPADDPFEMARSEGEPQAVPVDQLTPQERVDLEDSIRTHYKAIEDRFGFEEAELEELWLSIIRTLLINSTDFQAVVIDEYLTPGTYDIANLVIDPKLLLGIWLPGFYTRHDTFLEGYKKDLKVLCQRALPIAREHVERFLIDKTKHVLRGLHHDNTSAKDLQSQTVLQQTDSSISILYELARQEKQENVGRTKIRDNLARLQGFHGVISASEKLFERYASMNSKREEPDTIIERFAAGAMAMLAERYPHVSTSAKPLNHPSRFTQPAEFAESEAQVIDHGSDALMAEYEQDVEEKTAESRSKYVADELMFDDVAEQGVVSQLIRGAPDMGNEPVHYYPGWRKPNGPTILIALAAGEVLFDDLDEEAGFTAAPRTTAAINKKSGKKAPKAIATLTATSRQLSKASDTSKGRKGKGKVENTEAVDLAGSESEELSQGLMEETEAVKAIGRLKGRDMTVPRVAQRSESYRQGRYLSQEQAARIEEKYGNIEDTIAAAIAYLSDPQQHLILDEPWVSDIVALGANTERSLRATLATASEFKMPGRFVMNDNWYHTRCLLYTLREQFPDLEAMVTSFEADLIKLLALIHRGTTDPLPWILVLEGVARSTWTKICLALKERPALLLRKLFNEIKLFINGTVLNALWTRLTHRSGGTQRNLEGWYKLIHEYNPRCALAECHRELPKAPEQWPSSIRALFSVGVDDARIGRPDVRAHISRNRSAAYECVYVFLYHFVPEPDFVCVIFWYASFYHNVACKHARGKHLTQAF